MAITSTWGTDQSRSFPSISRELIHATRDWFEGRLNLAEIRGIEDCLPQRRNLALVVNNECNLRCKHCFLQIPDALKQRLTVGQWQEVIDSSLLEDIGQYLIVGKEVLLGQTGPEVVSLFGDLRKKQPSLRTGIITNGTLLHKHKERIEDASLNHMDISVDGDAQDHDYIRGSGAFEAVRPNIEWASRLLGDRLFLTLTLQKRNLRRLAEAIRAFSELGVSRVGISPLETLPYIDKTLALTDTDYRYFFDHLDSLEQLDLQKEMQIQIDACAISPDMLVHFIKSKWFDLNKMEMDGSGFMYSTHKLENGLSFSFRFLPWPLSVDFHTRLSATGDLVCAADGYLARQYQLNSLANVKDFDLDFSAAFNSLRNHPRLKVLDAQFESTVAPRIREAYRKRTGQSSASELPLSNPQPMGKLVPVS